MANAKRSERRAPLPGIVRRGDAGPSERPLRVAAQLRQEVARIVGRDLSDPRLEGVVITNAWMSADLQLAKVFFRLATTAEGAELTARCKDALVAFERSSGRVRKAVTGRLGLRVAPELRFVYDEGQDARERIEQVLHEIRSESPRERSGAERAGVGAPGSGAPSNQKD